MERALTRLAWAITWCACVWATEASAYDAQPAHAFAIVVANNRSSSALQPDLQYADDDGARYYRLFRSIAEGADVRLLTTFDRATTSQQARIAQFARPPKLRELLDARDTLLHAIEQAHSRGERTVFYFVYAGHGEMREGRGMLELEDHQIDGEFVEHELLDKLPADIKHVVLDSCNSFFVMNPRKPGGRRWATPKDMAFGFSARHPEVGLFLATNSESEVFEWSELESGVFSHEVRSGLSGGADANGDGAISYLELAGFVERANAGIARESLRPQLFYRGPHGDHDAPLFPTRTMRGRRVELSRGAMRLWIKNASGERLLDVHKEPGAMTLVLPEGETSELQLYVRTFDAAEKRTLVHEQRAEAGEGAVSTASYAVHSPEPRARGSRLFGELFREPYGPVAFAEYKRGSTATPEPVFGVGTNDLERTHRYLLEFAAEGRTNRMLGGLMGVGFGLIAGSSALALSLAPTRGDDLGLIAGSATISAALVGTGLFIGLSPSSGERALASFERELRADPKRGARAFAESERWLTRMAERERRTRQALFWTYEAVALGLVGLGTAVLFDSARGHEEQRDRALSSALAFSEGALFGALGAFVLGRQTPSERMLNLYREEPRPALQVGGSLSATSFGLSIKLSF